MAIIAENTLIIDSPNDLEAEMCRYNCHTKEELEELLWYDYGATLVLAYEHFAKGQDVYIVPSDSRNKPFSCENSKHRLKVYYCRQSSLYRK